LTAAFQVILRLLACELLACELHMWGQPFSELENCDPGWGHMPVASAGTGQEQGEFAWLHLYP